MYALQRLPSTTPGVSGELSLTTRYENSAAHRGFQLNADEFKLTTGESANYGLGYDHESWNELEVGTSAMRDDSDGDDFTEWLNILCGQAADRATEIEVSCETDDVDLSQDVAGIPWNENPLLDQA
jgi:hypothetical protein